MRNLQSVLILIVLTVSLLGWFSVILCQTYSATPVNWKRNGGHNVHSRNDTTYINVETCFKEVPTISVKAYKICSRVVKHNTVPNFSRIEICCNGYRSIDNTNKLICVPDCGHKCRNGYCHSPGNCICFNGFVKNDNDECVFACPLGCLNGICSLDETCKCNRGYTLDESKQFCRPICLEECGQLMNCTEPEICSCKQGYRLRPEGCIPECIPDCGPGGNCVEPNKCKCNYGYTLQNSVCQAECYQRCENGICLERNRCICYPGFRYHEKTATCVPATSFV